MRRLAFILLLLTTIGAYSGVTNYFDPRTANYHCLICGKGPLTHVWMHPRGPICEDCEQIKERCSVCGLPVRDGDGHIKTEDGRFICKWDKTSVVLTLEQAQDLFDKTRDEVVDLYGPRFVLKYNDVTVKLFDVDYWSEKQGETGMHKFGFSHTRKTSDGRCTHEVVLLSGRTREEMIATAAHEYTHLWINENRPDDHTIDPDTVEAICELTAYKLMQKKNLPELQKRILDNPYTNGKIKTLIGVEHDGGTDYVMKWVKESKDEAFDASANLPVLGAAKPVEFNYQPKPLAAGLKFTGTMDIGRLQAVINGVAFSPGDEKTLRLQDRSLKVRCDQIDGNHVRITVNGTDSFTLNKGEEKSWK